MARRARSGGQGPLWHGYRRPVWRDKVFWTAVGIGLAGLLVQDAFGDVGAATGDWIVLGVEVVATFAISFVLVGVVAGTVRGFGEGWRQAETAAQRSATSPRTSSPSRPDPAQADPPRADPPQASPSPDPAPTATEPTPPSSPDPEPVAPAADAAGRPKAGVEMERQARRLGRAIAAGRRTYKAADDPQG